MHLLRAECPDLSIHSPNKYLLAVPDPQCARPCSQHWVYNGECNSQGFPRGSDGKELACNAGDLGSVPGSGRSLEKGMTTHSNILDWRIPWTDEIGGLQSIGLPRVRRLTLSVSNKQGKYCLIVYCTKCYEGREFGHCEGTVKGHDLRWSGR